MIDGPYKLPKGWRWVRLGEVASRPQYGYTKSATLHPIGPKFVRITDITSGEIDWSKVPYCECDTKKLEKYRLYPGDVLFARSGSVGATILIKETPYDAVFASYLIRVRFRESVLSEFANLLLKAPVCQRQLIPQGAAQKNINARLIESILVPLPPMSEQQRIVAKVEMLMEQVREARRLRQKAVEDADRLWQSVLADTFPHPGTDLPSNWRWVRLVEIFEFQQGVSMSSKRRQGKNPKPFLRTRNIFWGKADISSIDETDFTDEEIEKFRLQSGDLLVCEGGDVGKTAIWEEQLPLVLYQNHIHRLRPVNALIESRFFMYWMQTAYKVFQEYQGLESRTAIPNLSSSRLKQFVAPLPPLDVQRHVVAHLKATQEKIKTLKDSQAQFETELQRLEQSILDSAFKGEL